MHGTEKYTADFIVKKSVQTIFLFSEILANNLFTAFLAQFNSGFPCSCQHIHLTKQSNQLNSVMFSRQMTVLTEVCTPPQVRRVDRYQTILDYPLSVGVNRCCQVLLGVAWCHSVLLGVAMCYQVLLGVVVCYQVIHTILPC